ncbi:MAG: BMP family ABC transporter substrate-binding protein [Gaiellaceae bacterium]|nr:MAG: BMP family ABC transporter substrate-binding protein [Gaiellaceae bacterium]
MNRSGWLVRMTVFGVVLALAAVAAGCGGGDEGGGGEGIRVGLVTDIGGLDDKSFNMLANQGLERARDELGVEIRVLQSQSDADYVPNLSTLAEEGYDLVISVGFLMGEVTEQVAKEYPDTNFAIIDYAYESPPSNLQGLVFKEQETGYLAGYLAGLMTTSDLERTNPEAVVSTVGGQKIPPVDRFIAGFQAGAKAANPDVETLNAYSQDFVDQAKCKEVALDQISKGSDVVFQVAGGCGLGALDAANERGVWGIGVDADQSHLGEHILTSAMKRVDQAVFATIEAVVNGEFTGGGVTVFGLAEDGVGLGEISPVVPQEMLDQVDDVRQQIVDGEIEIPETVS